MQNVSKSYRTSKGNQIPVFENVNFCISEGESLGLFGPSGSGKTTIAGIASALIKPDSGSVRFLGKKIGKMNAGQRRVHFRQIGMVWQDPVMYLNPYQSVFETVVEPLAAAGIGNRNEQSEKGAQLMSMLEIPAALWRRKPGMLSGGQCQRVAVARALILSPRLLICDEALVNLDLPQQVRIIRLLKRLQKELGTSILFISHDRSTVSAVCGHHIFTLADATS